MPSEDFSSIIKLQLTYNTTVSLSLILEEDIIEFIPPKYCFSKLSNSVQLILAAKDFSLNWVADQI